MFRVGGDEFTVIITGDDYTGMEELAAVMKDRNEAAKRADGIVIARGFSAYEEGDASVADVHKRADRKMYEDKSRLKEGGASVRHIKI